MLLLILAQLITACYPPPLDAQPAAAVLAANRAAPLPAAAVTPLPTRPIYQPGELVDYIAQTGDTLPALALRFNTTLREIRQANPNIPQDATTMPPGMPMKIPIYYEPFWGSSYEIIPDSLYVNGPAQLKFDPLGFVKSQPGWFKEYEFFTGTRTQKGGELVAQVASDYSISPRLLLAIIEFHTGALTNPQRPYPEPDYPLGIANASYKGLYRQLTWLANSLNNGYYAWRQGTLKDFDLKDGRIQRLDPWINASTAALQAYFSKIFNPDEFNQAISRDGLAKTYSKLFGDPWANETPHIPVNLRQPDLKFPFLPGHTWSFTGGPHTGYGDGEPFSAVDFAPPTVVGGCSWTNEYATALADGVIVRSEPAVDVLDLDGDGNEQTGWVIFYLHLAAKDQAPLGARLRAGDPVGHPSCEGGRATGTHVHIARKYNGEWIPADGMLAFNLEGWVVNRGSQAYEGTLTRVGQTVTACACTNQSAQVRAGD